MKKIAIIGAGRLGVEIARQLNRKFKNWEIIFGWIRTAGQKTKLRRLFPKCILAETNASAIAMADLVILTVKPTLFMDSIFNAGLDSPANACKLFISMMAVVRLGQLRQILNSNNVVRCSTTIGSGQGLANSFWASYKRLSLPMQELAHSLISALGTNCRVKNEKILNQTIIGSGCMFGLVAYHIKSYSENIAGKSVSPELARQILAGTFQNAAAYCLQQTSLSLDEIIAQVCTPGGITESMIHFMVANAGNFHQATIRQGLTKIRSLKRSLSKKALRKKR